MNIPHQVEALDLWIIGIFFAISFGIGLYERGKLTLADYWVNSRQTSKFVIVATTLSSFIGAASILGNGSVAFSGGGLAVLAVPISYFLYFFLFAKYLAPKIKSFGDQTKSYTLPDFLEYRFSSRVRIVSAVVILVSWALYLALQILAFGLFVAAFTGFDPSLATIIAASITIVYTTVGGIRADMRTDVFQFFVMLILVSIFLPRIISEAGIDSILNLPMTFLNGSEFAPSYVWIFALLFLGVSVIASPDLWIRAYASKDQKSASQGMIASSFMVFIFMTSAVLLGVCGKVLMPHATGNSIIPDLLSHYIPTGIFGLVMAGFFATIMSSADTVLLIISMTLVRDIYQKFINPTASDELLLKLSRTLIIALGIVGLIVALVIFNIAHLSIEAVSFYAALIPAVLFGFYSKNPSERKAFWSILVGFITIVIFLFISPVQAFIPGIISSFVTYRLVSR